MSSSLEVERCNQRNEEVTVSRDSISSLPNDLFIQILLLVPTKDAMATMVLSKRWRYLWTLVPKIEYTDTSDECESMLGNWLQNAVDRSVRKVELELLWTAKPTSLRKSFYTCKTLVEMTLSDKILVDVPTSVCLPSLKILRLFFVIFKDEYSLERLLSSCLVLAGSRVYLGINDFWRYPFPIVNKLRFDVPRISVFCKYDDKFLRAISIVTSLILSLEHPMDNNGYQPGNLAFSWNQPSLAPRCLSSHLEEFAWEGYRASKEEKQLMRYILANSKCLKKVAVALVSTSNLE
ncbi:PREDICTED: putative F-box/FBD/LRR-repeat protein At5g52460 [Camelina sativa]|uniref:F-box/FBD/LRR-repeat protein At5g52460 n=1 Tax=Camelina sativa TaxID=90675 RepID=A0ABM0XF81_CAMSA|nr:PREDICTED: putative F-box/FBD/LRR-repeat protein At5g52460 [Camelina sativa]